MPRDNERAFETIVQSCPNLAFSTAAVADLGDSQALWLPPGSASAPKAIEVGFVRLHNRSGSTANVGLAVRFPQSAWVAGQVTAAGVYTADTTDAQDVGAGDFPLHDKDDSGSGFLIGCTAPFNCYSLVQSAAGDQTTPVEIQEYWNGTAWTDIVASNILAPAALIGASTGEKVRCWPLPPDWALGGSGTGVPATTYNLRVRHTTAGAGTTSPAASMLFVGYAQCQVQQIDTAGSITFQPPHPIRFPRLGDGLFGLFSVASRSNLIEVQVRGYY